MTRVMVPDSEGKDIEVVSFPWLLKWALSSLLAIFLTGLLFSWNISAQVRDAQHELENRKLDALRIAESIDELTIEVRALRRSNDSVLTIIRYERELRERGR